MNVRHGYLAGIASGLVLDAHGLYLFLAGLALGAGLVLAWGRLAGLLRWAGRHLERGAGGGSFRAW